MTDDPNVTIEDIPDDEPDPDEDETEESPKNDPVPEDTDA